MHHSQPAKEESYENDLDAALYLHEHFAAHHGDYDAVAFDDGTISIPEDTIHETAELFAAEYAERFLDDNPVGLTAAERERYDELPDRLKQDLVADMAADYISADAEQYDTLFDIPETDATENATSGLAKTAVATACTAGMLFATMSGVAAADPDSATEPTVEYQTVAPGVDSGEGTITVSTDLADTGTILANAEADGETDTDGDGLPDTYEEENGGDPMHMDVYVEIDYMESCDLPREELEQLKDVFADAPVENPDGETGINLHITSEEVPDATPFYWRTHDGPMNDMWDYRSAYGDFNDSGAHYIVLSKTYTNSSSHGISNPGDAMVPCESRTDLQIAHTINHELGHSMGLHTPVYDGIDSRNYSADEYPSAMNYNINRTYLGFSDGTHAEADFDDWGYLEENLHAPPVTEDAALWDESDDAAEPVTPRDRSEKFVR